MVVATLQKVQSRHLPSYQSSMEAHPGSSEELRLWGLWGRQEQLASSEFACAQVM